jgi:hypothetical protein
MMKKSLFKEKGATRVIDRVRVAWFETILSVPMLVAVGWYVGWSPFVEQHWAGDCFGAMLIVFAAWIGVFAVVQKNLCQINTRKRTVTSTMTTWYFKKIATQYSWDHFCIVRTVFMYSSESQQNRVELVSKDMQSVLPIAFFPAITKRNGRSLFAKYEYENPMAIQMRVEISQLMSLPDQGYVQEHYLRELK